MYIRRWKIQVQTLDSPWLGYGTTNVGQQQEGSTAILTLESVKGQNIWKLLRNGSFFWAAQYSKGGYQKFRLLKHIFPETSAQMAFLKVR
jgi:hypothetical protein